VSDRLRMNGGVRQVLNIDSCRRVSVEIWS